MALRRLAVLAFAAVLASTGAAWGQAATASDTTGPVPPDQAPRNPPADPGGASAPASPGPGLSNFVLRTSARNRAADRGYRLLNVYSCSALQGDGDNLAEAFGEPATRGADPGAGSAPDLDLGGGLQDSLFGLTLTDREEKAGEAALTRRSAGGSGAGPSDGALRFEAGPATTNWGLHFADPRRAAFSDAERSGSPLSAAYSRRINELLSFRIPLPFPSAERDGSRGQASDQEVAFPIRACGGGAASDLTVTLTPGFSSYTAVSPDALTSGDIVSPNLAFRMEKRFGNVRLTYGNCLGYFRSVGARTDGFGPASGFGGPDASPNVNQVLIAHVVKGAYLVSDNWFVDGYSGSVSLLREQSHLTNYRTFGAGVGVRTLDQKLIVRFGASGDFGNEASRAVHAGLSAQFRF